MNIKIELNDINVALNGFNKEMISQELDDFIVNSCEYKFFRKNNITLDIYGINNKDDQDRIREVLHKHYKNKLTFLNKIDKFENYYRVCLLILGIAAILLSEKFVSFLSELFLIAGWVVIWEIIYDVIFNEIRRKRRENIYKKLSKAKISFMSH